MVSPLCQNKMEANQWTIQHARGIRHVETQSLNVLTCFKEDLAGTKTWVHSPNSLSIGTKDLLQIGARALPSWGLPLKLPSCRGGVQE